MLISVGEKSSCGRSLQNCTRKLPQSYLNQQNFNSKQTRPATAHDSMYSGKTKTVAIAGAGDVAKYVVEALLERKHRVVVLSREKREWFTNKQGVEVRTTDYTVESLTSLLADVDVLISTYQDLSSRFVDVHLAMIEAIQRSPRCKRFIPSEYGGDIEQFPLQPGYYVPTRVPVREKLLALKAEAKEPKLEFAIICPGWFADYFAPSTMTYLKEGGDFWPIDVGKKTARVPGTGNEKVTFTAVQDVARAMVRLVETDEEWEPYIYMSGSTTTWNEAVKITERTHGIKLNATYHSVAELEQTRNAHANDADPTLAMIADLDILSAVGAGGVPEDKVARHRTKYFDGLHFRTVEEIIAQAHSLDK